MPELNIPDFDKVEIAPPQLDPGVYVVNVQQAPEVKTHDNGKMYLEVYFTVLEGPNQTKVDPVTGSQSPVGRRVRDWLWLVEGGYFRVKQLLIAAGLLTRGDNTSPLAQGKFNSDILTGARLSVEVIIDPQTKTTPDGRTTTTEYRRVNYIF